MADDIFSWQKEDLTRLIESLKNRIVFVHGKDLISSYSVISGFRNELENRGCRVFAVSKRDPSIESPLLPFFSSLEEDRLKSSWDWNLTQSLIGDLTHSDTLAQLAKRLTSTRPNHSLILNEKQNELLIQLEYATKGRTPFFIFYQYPSYDFGTKEMIKLLLAEELERDFHFLSDAKYYFISDTEEEQPNDWDVKNYTHSDVYLTDPQKENMLEILREITPELDLNAYDLDKLFYLSGGRLSVIEILGRYLSSQSLRGTGNLPSSAIIRAIIDNRLHEMGAPGQELKSMLEVAAAIGNQFPVPLLQRAVNPAVECDILLKRSDEEFFTKSDSHRGEFYYPEIHHCFYQFGCDEEIVNISRSVERAIYDFNPFDYLSRARHLENAGEIAGACELYIYAYDTIFREGFEQQPDLVNKITELCKRCGLIDFWETLRHYYAAFENLELKNALSILEDETDAPTIRLLLLKEYLTGLCFYKTEDTWKDAIIILEKVADQARELEEGIWCDSKTALVSFYANSGELKKAQETAKELLYYYTQKKHAPYAEKGLHALERKWSAVYSVERSVVKTEKSVAFFRNSSYVSQYIMSLNNHGANLIVLNRLDEAFDYLTEAIQFIAQYKCTCLNTMYILSNFYLCLVLQGKIPPAEAILRLEEALADRPFGDWAILVRINCAIYHALSGALSLAKEQLSDLEITSIKMNDDYYLYYTRANLASVYYLEGNVSKATDILLNQCDQPPVLMKEVEKTYLRQRRASWLSVMENTKISDPIVFDHYLCKLHPGETRWGTIGRGFLYSDIQYWSEP